MEITNVSVKTVEDENPVKAYCTIIFDSCFVVRNIRILEKDNKFMVCMPSLKNKREQYFDVCYPNTRQMREKINTAILSSLLGQLKASVL